MLVHSEKVEKVLFTVGTVIFALCTQSCTRLLASFSKTSNSIHIHDFLKGTGPWRKWCWILLLNSFPSATKLSLLIFNPISKLR